MTGSDERCILCTNTYFRRTTDFSSEIRRASHGSTDLPTQWLAATHPRPLWFVMLASAKPEAELGRADPDGSVQPKLGRAEGGLSLFLDLVRSPPPACARGWSPEASSGRTSWRVTRSAWDAPPGVFWMAHHRPSQAVRQRGGCRANPATHSS